MLLEVFNVQAAKAMPVHQACRTIGSCDMSPSFGKGVEKNLRNGGDYFRQVQPCQDHGRRGRQGPRGVGQDAPAVEERQVRL